MFSAYIAVNLVLGAAVLCALLPLRSANGRLRQAVLGMCLGAIAALVGINVLMLQLHASRDSNIRPVVKYALQHADPSKPQLLFVGSSYTALGVDAPLIERELDAHGYGLQVLDLAKAGNYMISQDYTLDYYLARAKKVPEYVFLEIGPENYTDTGAMGDSYIYTGTAIADHAPDQLWWRVRSIAAYRRSPAQQFNDYWNLGTHALFHVFDFGLSGQMLADTDVHATPAFAPQNAPHTPLVQSDIAALTVPASVDSSGESALDAKMKFIVAFRKMQVRKLKARGVKVVGFYQTELAPVEIRGFGMQICRAMQDVPCIIADDPALQRKLDRPSMWFDPVHLLRPGAEIYSAWLGNRLASALSPYRTTGQ